MDESEALAVVAVSLRTRNRPTNLLAVSSAIRHLSAAHDYSWIADRAGVSVGMLRKFLAVDRLDATVQHLFKIRSLDRVTDAFLLSKVRDRASQRVLAQKVLDSELNTKELADVTRMMRQNRKARVKPTVARVVRGRRVRKEIFAVVMPIETGFSETPKDLLRRSIDATLPNSGISMRGSIVVVFFDKQQYEAAKKRAKNLSVDLTGVAERLLRGSND